MVYHTLWSIVDKESVLRLATCQSRWWPPEPSLSGSVFQFPLTYSSQLHQKISQFSFTREDGGNCCKTDSGGSRASRKVETSFKSFTKILFWALLSNKSTCLQFPISCFLLLMVSLLHLYSILMFIVNSVILSIHGHGVDIFVGSNQNFTTGRSWAARQASACMSCRFVSFFYEKKSKNIRKYSGKKCKN